MQIEGKCHFVVTDGPDRECNIRTSSSRGIVTRIITRLAAVNSFMTTLAQQKVRMTKQAIKFQANITQ